MCEHVWSGHAKKVVATPTHLLSVNLFCCWYWVSFGAWRWPQWFWGCFYSLHCTSLHVCLALFIYILRSVLQPRTFSNLSYFYVFIPTRIPVLIAQHLFLHLTRKLYLGQTHHGKKLNGHYNILDSKLLKLIFEQFISKNTHITYTSEHTVSCHPF